MTAPVELSRAGDVVRVSCPTEGALIGWTTTPPAEPAPDPLPLAQRVTGQPVADGRVWRIVTGPFAPPPGETVWLRAWRLGWRASPEVAVPAGASFAPD